MAQSKFECELTDGKVKDVFEEPLCLIDNDKKTGKFCCHTEVLEQIEKIEKQLNSIAITGFYRTGKSYLMSRLAGKTRGFPLGSTVQSKTKGIWVWCRPHPKDSEQVLLLMDSEGLGDVEKGDPDHDGKLFALITLLCSTLIYNTIGVLNQDMLDKLNFITEISRNIKTKETVQADDDSYLDLYFPELILALRDRSLDMNIDGKDITPDEYVEHCLHVVPGDDEATRKKNRPRLCIRKYFKQRHCFTFERPGNRKVLKNLEELTDDDLDELFVEDTKKFLDYVYNNCTPLTVMAGKIITGSMFAQLVKSYVETVNSGGVQCIDNAVKTMTLIENQKGVEKAVETYKRNMQEKIRLQVADEDLLKTVHQQCLDAAMKVFYKHAFLDDNKEYFFKTEALIWKEYETIRGETNRICKNACKKLLEKLHSPIKQAIENKKYAIPGGYKQYKADIDQMIKIYETEGSHFGAMKNEVLRNFIEETKTEDNLVMIADERIDAAQRTIELEKQNAEAALRNEWSIKEELEKQNREIIVREKHMTTAMNKLKENHEEELQKQQKKIKEILQARLLEAQRLNDEHLEKEAVKTKQEIDRLIAENKLTRLKSEKELRRFLDAGEERRREFAKQIKQLQTRITMAKSESECEPTDGKVKDVFEEPLCLIDDDKETGKFRCHTEVLEQSEKIEKQSNTIANTGLYRTDKSYFMSRLAGKTRETIAPKVRWATITALDQELMSLEQKDTPDKALGYNITPQEGRKIENLFETACLGDFGLNSKLLTTNIFFSELYLQDTINIALDKRKRKDASVLLKYACSLIRNRETNAVFDVMATYKPQKEWVPIFVVLGFDNIMQKWGRFLGFDVYYRKYDHVSSEAAVVMNELIQKQIVDPDEQDWLKGNEIVENLIKCHSNITLITVCPCKSSNSGDIIIKHRCIVIHCLVKGFIPFDEEPFPKQISDKAVDVREGYVSLGMEYQIESMDYEETFPPRNQNPPTGKKSTYRNIPLLMGTSISRDLETGTLGGFVALSNGEVGFVTCAHVAGFVKGRTATISQPSLAETPQEQRNDSAICGYVVKTVFDSGSSDKPGVDAAVVKVMDRLPGTAEFIWVSPERLRQSGFDPERPPEFASGRIMSGEELRRNRDKVVLKFGSQTGLTRGIIELEGTYLKPFSRKMKHETIGNVEMFNQIEVRSYRDPEPFFLLGDSGSLVFIRIDDELRCIGLAIGLTNYHSCIVTPIDKVLESLQLGQEFLNFSAS